jgi:hypothetical protein
MGYLIAWIVMALAAAGGTLAIVRLTSDMAPGLTRNLIRFLPATLLLVPAPIPGYGGNFAPAFLVVVFESLFLRDGRPFGAAAILFTGVAIATLLIAFASNWTRGTPKEVAAGPDDHAS